MNCELTSKIAVLSYSPDVGGLTLVEMCSTLPDGFSGANHNADLHIHPSGRWVYVSNRGHDSIAIFEVGEEGRLALVAHRGSGGLTPRNFAVSPDGAYLLVANQDSDSVVVMRIDHETGVPTETVSITDVPTPVCLKFAPTATGGHARGGLDTSQQPPSGRRRPCRQLRWGGEWSHGINPSHRFERS